MQEQARLKVMPFSLVDPLFVAPTRVLEGCQRLLKTFRSGVKVSKVNLNARQVCAVIAL